MARITRSEARKKAFEIIFASLSDTLGVQEQVSLFAEENPKFEQQFGYITKAVTGAVLKAEETEASVNANIADGWTYKRLSKMCRAILLLSVYEMKYIEDVPPKVAINEAVELAKIYGDDNEPSLINGILGSVMRNECNE